MSGGEVIRYFFSWLAPWISRHTTPGGLARIPNTIAASARCRRLNVVRRSAPPFTAVSRTISSAGSFSRGLQRNRSATGSITAASASSTSFISSALKPLSFKCSGRVSTASYSSISGTEANTAIRRPSAASKSWRDTPRSLRIAATTTSVSSTSRIEICKNDITCNIVLAMPRGKAGTAIQFQRRELVAVPVLRRRVLRGDLRPKSCALYSTGIILADGFQMPARAGCRTIDPLPSERTFLSRNSPEVSNPHPMKTSVRISRGVESLFGTRDENIRLIESGLGVHTQLVDNSLEIEGEAAACSRAESILEDYNALLREGFVFNNGDLNSYLRVVTIDPEVTLRALVSSGKQRNFGKKILAPKTVDRKSTRL